MDGLEPDLSDSSCLHASQIVEFIRKFILSSVIIFIKPGSSVQILSGLMICAAFQVRCCSPVLVQT